MKHTMKKLLAALLACLLLLSSVALADQTSTVNVSQGEQIIDENVTVSSQNASGVNATGGEVTVNGNVTASGKQGKGVKASGGEVTVNGDVQATGEGGVAVQSSGDSTVNVTGDANGYHFGVDASGGSTVTVGKDAIGGAAAVQAIGEETKVTVEGNAHSDESTGAYAANGSTIEVKGNVSGGMGAIAVGSTLEVGGDVTGGYTGVDAYGEGTEVNVTGNVTATTGTGVNAAGGAQVTVGTAGNNNTVEGAAGVEAGGADTKVTVNGDVTATGDEGRGVEAYQGGEVTVNGSVESNYTGVYAHADSNAEEKVGGKVTVTGDVHGIIDGVFANDNSEITVTGNASATNGTGVNAYHGSTVTVGGSVTGGDDGVDASGGSTVNVGTEGSQNTVTGDYYGVMAHGENTNVTVIGDVFGSSFSGVNASDGSAVTVTGNVTGGNDGVRASYGSTVTVTGNVTGVNSGKGKGVNVDDSSTVNVTGDVTGDKYGVVADDENTNVTVTGNVTATGDEGTGVNAYDNGTVTVNGNVTATGDEGTGVDVYDNGTVTVNGNVTAMSETGKGVNASDGGTVTVNGNVESEGTGVVADANPYSDEAGGNVTVNGRVTAKGTGVDAKNGGIVEVKGNVTSTGGIGASAIGGGTQVTVQGDVKGEGGVGMELTGDKIQEGNPPADSTKRLSVVVNGTVSGKDGVGDIVVKKSKITTETVTIGGNTYPPSTSTQSYTTDNIDLAVWKVEGEDAIRVVDVTVEKTTDYDDLRNDTETTTVATNAAATEAFLQTVNYIIRLFDGEGISSAMVSEAQSVAVDQENYYTAHEGEKVKLGVALDEGEVLQGVYYDGADESTLTEVADLEKDESGSFFIAMKRYGGMLLKLKTHKHSPATVKENEVAATCTREGSYEEVKKCSVCGVEMSREKKTVDKLGHTGGSAVKENIVAAKPGVKGHYDEVVYCSVCKEELSRKTVEIDALPVEEETKTEEKAEETKTEEKTEEKAEETKPAEESEPAEEAEESAANAPRTEFVYVPVDANTEVNGVKAADRPGMAEAFKKVGDSLDGEGASIDIVDKEKLMDAEELKRFDRLSVKDRLLVALKALGFGEALGEIADDMSDDAVALSDDITARVDALTDAEKQALLDRLYGSFLPRLIIIDGQEYEAVGIEVVITRGGEKSYERYTFYKDEGAWKLYQIEKGEYRTVAA